MSSTKPLGREDVTDEAANASAILHKVSNIVVASFCAAKYVGPSPPKVQFLDVLPHWVIETVC